MIPFMSILFRRSFKTSIFSRLLKVTMATSNIMTEVYIGGIVPEYSVSMLKETIALVWHYVYETRKEKAKLAERYIWNWNIKSFSNETINLFFRKFWASSILDLAKSVRAPRILSQKSTRNYGMKEILALENHVLVDELLCSSHFTKVS